MKKSWHKAALIAFLILFAGVSLLQDLPASAETVSSPTAAPTEAKNYAPLARVETTFPSLSPITLLNDGNTDSAWSSTVTPGFPNYITFDLDKTAITTSKIVFIAWFAQGQGVTDVDVEYEEDGQWKTAVQNATIEWSANDATKEVREVVFPEVKTSKLRVKINAANTIWGNIAINELQWWGTEPPPEIVNVAPDGLLTVEGVSHNGGTERLNDGDELTGWSGVPVAKSPAYIVFDSVAKRVRTDKLAIVVPDAKKHGVKKVDLDYFNGETWVALKQDVNLVWTPATEGTAVSVIGFDPITAHKLRIRINKTSPANEAFTINEIQLWGYTIEPPAPQYNVNVAPSGQMSVSFAHTPGQSPSLLNDGDMATSWTSKPNQTFPGSMTLTFDREITTKKISLASSRGVSGGISNVTVEYLLGQSWKTAAENVPITWNSDSDAVEQADLIFGQIRADAIRIRVNETRSSKGQVSLSEIKVWDAARVMPQEPPFPPLPEPAVDPIPEPEPVNLAGTATASTTFPLRAEYAIGWINDGSNDSVWSSGVGVAFPGYITLDWGDQVVRTNKMTLYTWFAQGQGITDVDVEYEKKGEWVKAVTGHVISWTTNDTTYEPAEIAFPIIETSKIRLKVNRANTAWGNIGLNEWKVWEAQ